MLTQIAVFLVDTLATILVMLLLARFHFQWLRAPFRNPLGEFVLATTNWLVLPARRVIPGLAGLDLATLLLAWLLQALGMWLQVVLIGGNPPFVAIALVALVDLVRYSLYILGAAVILQAVFSWINPYSAATPILDTLTRPFLRPLRRFIPPVSNIDLTPLVVIVLVQVALIALAHVRTLAASVGVG